MVCVCVCVQDWSSLEGSRENSGTECRTFWMASNPIQCNTLLLPPSGLVDIKFLYPGVQCIKEKVLLQLQPRSVQWSAMHCDVKMSNERFYGIIVLLSAGAHTNTHDSTQQGEEIFIFLLKQRRYYRPTVLQR